MTILNYNKLKGRLVEYGYGRKDLAKLLGVSQSTISQKLNSASDFSTTEILCIMEWLDIPKEKIADYFFVQKVEK